MHFSERRTPCSCSWDSHAEGHRQTLTPATAASSGARDKSYSVPLGPEAPKSLHSKLLPSCFWLQPANHLVPQLSLFPQDILCSSTEQQAKRGNSTDLLQLEHCCRPRPRKGCSQIFILSLLWSGFTGAPRPSGLLGLRGTSKMLS